MWEGGKSKNLMKMPQRYGGSVHFEGDNHLSAFHSRSLSKQERILY